jgi:hypothetical protein
MHSVKAFASNTHLRIPALVSTVVVLPFVMLEWVNRRDFHDGFPIPLFGLMWLLSFSFIVVLMPVPRRLSAGNRHIPNPFGLLSRVGLLIAVAWLFVSLVLDQMPCFLGVPNCD